MFNTTYVTVRGTFVLPMCVLASGFSLKHNCKNGKARRLYDQSLRHCTASLTTAVTVYARRPTVSPIA